MAKNDINIRAGIVGKEAIKNDLGEIVGYVENYTNKLKNADFSVFNKLADKLNRGDFGAGAVSNMQKLGQQTALTRQQALALTYTFNDVSASLASGISPMTILLQQGGQLTQAFGGIGGTVRAIVPQLLRWAPAIGAAAAGAAAVAGSFLVLSKGADAAKKLNDLADATERARVSQEALNKLSAALIAKGVPADQAPKQAEQLFGKLRNTLLSTRDAQVELNKSRKEFAKTVQPPGAGDNAFDQLEQTGKFLKTVKPPSDAGRIGPVVNKYAELKDIISQSGQDVSKLTGKEQDLFKMIDMLAEAYRRAGSEAKRFKLELQIDKIDPKLTEIVKSGGMGFVNQADAAAGRLGPRPTTETVKAGQEAEIINQQNLAAEQDKQLMMDSRLISSSRAKYEARQADLAKEAESVSLLNQAYQRLNETITAAYQVKSGNPQAQAENPTMTTLNTRVTEIDAALAAVTTALSGFASTISSAAGSFADTLRRLAQESFSFGPGARRGADYSGGSGNSGFASGGFVSGPGTSTSDSIPAWLSSGEYVVRAAAVKRYGVGLMHAINGMAAPRRGFGFAAGGLVPPSSVAMAGGSSGGRGLTLVLDGKSFGGMSGSNDAMDALERYAIARRISSTTKRTPSRVG